MTLENTIHKKQTDKLDFNIKNVSCLNYSYNNERTNYKIEEKFCETCLINDVYPENIKNFQTL